ncbi:hypothetical protein PFDG_04885 [Plasmodium falciparum Dd2]|uniref:Uncharacterized protein n=1 Tax=Plasmodium falciparum (isolate Dd2) TaxID=57267 RepID=A0A0L7M948_PLAF4|nr:hypothetical protein PFDG_04885 [Plasmodium falciparum Dd2]
MKINIIKAFGILLCRLKKYNPVTTGDINKFEFLFLKASYADKHWTPPKGIISYVFNKIIIKLIFIFFS